MRARSTTLALTAAAVLHGLAGATAADMPSVAVRTASPFPAAAASSPFQGIYLAGGTAYGISSSREFSVSATNIFGATGDVDPKGWSGVIVGGVNLVSGPFLFGLEIDGRIAGERESHSVTLTFPSQTLTPFDTGSGVYSYRFRNDGGLDLAARFGIAMGQTLIFVKGGAGVVKIAESFTADDRAASFCLQTAFVGVATVTQVCRLQVPGGIGSATVTHWRPSAILGVGAEQNFGAWFGRIYADAEWVSLQSTRTDSIALGGSRTFTGSAGGSGDSFWTTRGGALVGFRF